ncbi:methylmalonyl-CoA mutase [Nocardioides szechwanensis]|uniref:Heterodimeric methylmalonyl-CoA mutase small subunit n=1 Tax=Nocardioides szechwanensis TaxID=1005944 RepID=A0A1H0LV06_9ACTN|nr:methylmalonyl-CoA mutase family protein [Nocardioides szechwanensis]GEP35999.1 methylmalonyl-CoA mutase [Nocardioides szechwanensis]SDO71933.1 heterodimeric methylmalonyl-CoA mutase small subunit [Nocardioides szechwanensis]
MSVDGSASGTVAGGLDEPEELAPTPGSLELTGPGDQAAVADWEAAAAAVLRKARRLTADDPDSLVWDKLGRKTLDGITIPPLGTAAALDDLKTSGRPTRTGDWDIRAHLAGTDAKALNETALVDLDGGVTSLWLQVGADTDLATLLDGVLLDLAPVVLEAPSGAQAAIARAFLDVLGDTTPAPGTNLGGTDDDLVDVARLALERGVLGVVVDATRVHDRGASDVQELGWSMATAAAYLRRLTDAGIDLDEALGLFEFRYAATDEQFLSIAKLRAARRLWARVVELSGGAPIEQRQHVVTSRPMMSRYDPYVNMLRTTVAGFAAGVGGADSVTVLPFDAPLGSPEVLGRRVARNTSALLMAESHVAKVADPAGGAYAVEKLTDDLALAGWAELGRLEDDGFAALEQRIAETVDHRETEVAKRKRPITGLTEFPNLAEVLPERQPDGAFDGVRSYGASFEALRDEPAKAPVFLATLGTIASHTARATFAANLFAAGGIATEVAGATSGVDDLVAAYGGQRVVCLAGSDPTYAEWGSTAAAALREAGATHVIIAGKPVDGVDDSCAMGVDALDFLTRTREKLT